MERIKDDLLESDVARLLKEDERTKIIPIVMVTALQEVEDRIRALEAGADVFDALMSKRPYKEPFPLEKSYGIIRESRGSHFDPAVVDAFFASEKELQRIREEFQDKQESHFLKMNR